MMSYTANKETLISGSNIAEAYVAAEIFPFMLLYKNHPDFAPTFITLWGDWCWVFSF